MKWAMIVVLALAALAAAVALIGSRLPLGHSATRRAEIAAAPEAVWAAITDVQAFPSWRSDVKSVATAPDANGRVQWVEDTRAGKIPLVVERSEPPRVLVLRIADPDLPFGGTWTYAIAAAGNGRSTLTITEDGEVYNPIFRFMARFVFGYDGTMKTYLSNLERKFAPAPRG